MLKRVAFPLIALFWVVMNVLLWRAEFGGLEGPGSSVPVEVVWQKMLTAPDDSALEIRQDGVKLGYCRWVPNVGEGLATGKVAAEDAFPEGMVKTLTGYTLDLDGNVLLPGETQRRLRVNSRFEFGTNRLWRAFEVHAIARPQVVEVRADARTETLSFRLEHGAAHWEQTLTFAELRRPEAMLAAFGGPFALGFLAELVRDAGGPGADATALKGDLGASLGLGLQWSARLDWLAFGRTRVRVYRLETRVLDRYPIRVHVSRVGEILRVELPQRVTLLNEAFRAPALR